MKHKVFALAFCLTVALAIPAQAVIISFSFTPTLSSGADLNGFAASTWTFSYNIRQTTYDDFQGNAIAYIPIGSADASLTITGASNAAYNGTFTLNHNQEDDYSFRPGGGSNNAYLATPSLPFFIGPASELLWVKYVRFTGSAVAPEGVSAGDSVEASHWDGLSLSIANLQNSFIISSSRLGDDFDDSFIMPATLATAAVPEPSTYAALTGLAALGFVAYRRKRR